MTNLYTKVLTHTQNIQHMYVLTQKSACIHSFSETMKICVQGGACVLLSRYHHQTFLQRQFFQNSVGANCMNTLLNK